MEKLTVPPLYHQEVSEVTQALAWGDVHQQRTSPGDTMYATTGRRLYVIGDVDGGFRPRSNPYDLYNFGGPLPSDPLAGKLQGVWAQPVKGLNGYVFVIEAGGQTWPLLDADRFTQTFAGVQFDYRRGDLSASRHDFVPQDRPALFTTLTLRNSGSKPVDLRLEFFAYFDLEDAWFTSLAATRNHGELVTVEEGYLVARAVNLPGVWAVAVGGDALPAQTRVSRGRDGHRVGQLEYHAHLAPGAEHAWTFGVVIESQAGPQAALQKLEEWLPQREALLTQKRTLYDKLLTNGPRFHSPDPSFDVAFDSARANMQMLEAESPVLGRYFYAGLETFPFWFSSDAMYSAPGLLASNFATATKNHLRIGGRMAASGRVPHQVSPAGSVTSPGNAQETPQWVIALWDVYRWTGDRDLLAELYPVAIAGLFDYTLGTLDLDGDGHPAGPGMVEREDMGVEKLDSAAYLWAALNALAKMADTVDDPAIATRARAAADRIGARFDADWWDPQTGVYAMSLDETSNARRPAPHWAVVTPLEVGLAAPTHATTTFATLRAAYLNQWGLKHTSDADERVWTLPTATLSRGAYRYAEPELGFQMLQRVAATLDHGSIGAFHELIPDGLCFMQLWSSGIFVRGAIEDLMRMDVRADLHALALAPQLPAAWDYMELERLRYGEHEISVRATGDGVTITHLSGPAPLDVTYRHPDGFEAHFTVEPGDQFFASMRHP